MMKADRYKMNASGRLVYLFLLDWGSDLLSFPPPRPPSADGVFFNPPTSQELGPCTHLQRENLFTLKTYTLHHLLRLFDVAYEVQRCAFVVSSTIKANRMMIMVGYLCNRTHTAPFSMLPPFHSSDTFAACMKL